MKTPARPLEPPIDFERAQSFMTRVMSDLGGALVGVMCTLGDRLGLFAALAKRGPATSLQLAERAQVHERYVREWLQALAAAGYLAYDPRSERYSLPLEHALVLADEQSPMFMGGGFQQLAALTRPLDLLCEAFRFGGGVPQEAWGEELLSGMERMSATWFENMLTQHWLPATDLPERLERGAYVADVGCGSGRALVRLATVYPRARFVGYDRFAPVLERATARAEAAGVAGRVRFEERDAAAGLPERFDVVTAFDSLHDMARPAAALGAIYEALADDGLFLLMEMNCAETVEDNFGLNGAILYATSVLYNTPVTLTQGEEALGTMALPEPTIRRLCTEAGFASVRRLPVMNPFNILYEVLP